MLDKDTATRFDHRSLSNAATVKSILSCGCKPYEDVYTYHRWLALGYQVQRGQHGIQIPLIKEVEKEENGEQVTKKILSVSVVFCRCQVKPIQEGIKNDKPTTNRKGTRANPATVSSKYQLKRI